MLVQRSCYDTEEGSVTIFEEFPRRRLVILRNKDGKELTPVFNTKNLPTGSRMYLKRGHDRFAVEVFGISYIPFETTFKMYIQDNELHISVKYCGFDDDGNFIIVEPLVDYQPMYKLVYFSPSGENKFDYIPKDEVLSFTREGDKLRIIYNERNIGYKQAQLTQNVFIEDTLEVISQDEFWENFKEKVRIYPEDDSYCYEIIGVWKENKVRVKIDDTPITCNWSGWSSWDLCPNNCVLGDDSCWGCEWSVLPAPITVVFLKDNEKGIRNTCRNN